SAEPQNPKGYPDLGRPATRGRRDPPLPILVPIAAELGVVVMDAVEEAAGGRDGELERALPFSARVERDRDPVRFDLSIPPRQAGDASGAQLLAVDAHVDRIVVVEDADRGAFTRRLALVRTFLREGVAARRVGPGGVVELAVDARWHIGPFRREMRRG